MKVPYWSGDVAIICQEKGLCSNYRMYMAVMQVSFVRRTSWSPGMVRHVLPYWWRKVPSWKQKVSHNTDPYVRLGQSLYRECVTRFVNRTIIPVCANDVHHGSVIFMKWCVIILTQICVNVFKWWVTVSDGGCVMVYKYLGDAHRYNDAPFPGVKRCILQMTPAL